jgi:hypothetical protein
MSNANAPAHPQLEEVTSGGSADKAVFKSTPGLTKREYFAGLALQGLLSAERMQAEEGSYVALKAVKLADALLWALEKK